MSHPVRVLVVDDERFVRESLIEILKREDLHAIAASGAEEAIRALESQPFDVIVTDLKMPKGDGMSLLQEARRRGVAIPIIVVTGVGTVSSAVEAMKAGAFDFVQKPVDPAELVLLVRRAAEHRGLLSEVHMLRHAVEDLRGARELVGGSPAMKRVRESIAKVAPTDATVLLRGESGTGKELAAEEIHRASRRAASALVRVNCAALSAETIEAELFGARAGPSTISPSISPANLPSSTRGLSQSQMSSLGSTSRSSSASTSGPVSAAANAEPDHTGKFGEAEGGTLVLDKIGMLLPSFQAKLLAVLEQGEYRVVGEPRVRKADVRVIAITNLDLSARVKSGEFRADLYYLLNQFPIELPPLRAHKEDIPEIAEHLLERARRRQRLAGASAGPQRLSREALEVLASYDWPGNVRELGNAIERAVIVAGSADLDAELFRGILESTLPLDVRLPPEAKLAPEAKPAPDAMLAPEAKPAPDAMPAPEAKLSPSRSIEANQFHLRRNLDAVERDIVLKAIAHTQGKKKEAALLLGIDPRNLGYYLRKHKITET